MLCLCIVAAGPARAWSELGHRIIGDLAETRLTSAARTAVDDLLAGEDEATLGGVAAWADALRRRDPARFRVSARWHYINARGGGCQFDEARDCAQGGCIVSAITAQHRILADPAQPRGARRDALKFLVHFVGDLHQPLHAGPREDSGGNGFQVSLRREAPPGDGPGAPSTGRGSVSGTNLHAVWDARVLASAGLTRVQYVARLRPGLAEMSAGTAGTPMQWARESCALVESHGLYPDARAIGRDYLDAHRPLAEQRVRIAAARLAALLNEALAPGRQIR